MNLSARLLRLAVVAVTLGIGAAACGGSQSTVTTGTPSVTTPVPNTTAPVATTPPATTAVAPATEPPVDADADRAVQAGDAISVHYVGTLDDGSQFDSSRDRGTPLSFTVGSGQMISGFDDAVRGMTLGEIRTVRLEPNGAYGESDESLVITVPITDDLAGVEVGDTVFSGGRGFPVVGITADSLLVDTNHRLAGQFLTFEIELVSFDG